MYKHKGKVVIKILQGSAVTQTVLGGLAIAHTCQKLWKLAGSRQSCWKNYLAYFFGPPCIYSLQRRRSQVNEQTETGCSSAFNDVAWLLQRVRINPYYNYDKTCNAATKWAVSCPRCLSIAVFH